MQRQHRELRRRRRSRHDLRPVGRRRKDDDRDGDAVGKGLFHRAIAQSGSAFRGVTASDASDGAERFLAKLGIKKDELEKIQQLDSAQIQTAFYSEPAIPRLGGGPVIDGTILPRHQWDPTAPSYSANVPLIAGSVENENGWVGPPPYELADDEMANRFTGLANKDAAEGTKLLALYKRLHPQTRNQMLWLMAEADEQRRWSAQELCRLKAEQGTARELSVFLRLAIARAQRPDGLVPHARHPVRVLQHGHRSVDDGLRASALSARARDERGMGRVRAHGQSESRRTCRTGRSSTPSSFPTMVFGEHVRVANDPNKEERLALAALRAKRPS